MRIQRPPADYDQRWMIELVKSIEKDNNLSQKLAADYFPARLLLKSPGNKIFSITVSDDGILAAEELIT